MSLKNKAKIKTLEMAIASMRMASRCKNVHERQAAVDLEVEFTERIAALKKGDTEPELALPVTADA